jgi:alpha-1,2-mannosyltransferase
LRFIRLASLINLLTPDRARAYALLTILAGSSLALFLFVVEPQRLRDNVDFPAFYNAGRIVNEYPQGSLYNRELQRALYLQVTPRVATRSNLFFVYTPFFALVFAPLALLPYLSAFVCWMLISLALFIAGFRLAWTAASLPVAHRATGFVIALGFLPFYFLSLLAGQTVAFGFFWLALAIYFDRKGRPFWSGCALALLLYKPPLLILLVPMLVLTKRWRTLAGFCVGGVMVGLLSLAVIGVSDIPRYFDMLAAFSHDKAIGRQPIWNYVDAYSFFLPLVGGRLSLAAGLVVALVLIVIPLLFVTWRLCPERAWAHAITWTLVLNLYVPIQDSTLIILAALLSIKLPALPHSGVSTGFRWLLLALFVVPWVARQSAGSYGFQPMTVALVAFGFYQFWLNLKKEGTRLAL